VKKLKLVSLVLLVLGITGATLLIGWYGLDPILAAILSVGKLGFAAYAAWQVATFAILGVAWWAIVPPGRKRLGLFVWGRMVRDAGASCLPFSQVGGFVMGARAVRLGGMPTPIATISTAVDLTAEFVAEILFLIVGLAILLAHSEDMSLALPLEIGFAVALLAGVLAWRLQGRSAALLVKFGRRLIGQFFTSADGEVSEEEMAEMYRHTGRLAAGTLVHLAGWAAKGGGNWIAFRLLGAPVDIGTALAIEALLHAMLAAAVLVPGFAGVQEAGYAGLGHLFGVAPEISLAVSLLRRARDLAVGIPILLVWQFVEMRVLRKSIP
jgi:putative membrane protein